MNLPACAAADVSPLARLRATGRDIVDLLHRLGTQDLRGLGPGDGRVTVLTSPKGRIVERLFVHHLGADGVLLVAGEGRAEAVVAHLRKYTFAEDTGLADATASTAQIALAGPRAREAASALGPVPPPYGTAEAAITGVPAHVLGHDGYGPEGVSYVVEAGAREAVAAALAAAAGGVALDAAALEAWRVARGFPASGHELTEDWNPLEAGLHDAVSFTKGCYVGQEVVARLNTYDKVSRRIVGLEIDASEPPPPGAVLVAGDRDIGVVTSAARDPDGGAVLALALAKMREIDAAGGALAVRGGGRLLPARLRALR